MEPKYKVISISALHLDPENPRHDAIGNEPEIIATLYKRGVPKLAEHIAQNGLSPLKRLAVMKHERVKNHFVALEGNRRVCALKLLRDPSKAPHAAGRRLFEQLKERSGELPDRVQVAAFNDRSTADKWLAVEHEGPQDGIGTVSWDTDEKARFNRRSGSKPNPNLQALALREYALAHNLITADENAQINTTTLTRYLSTKLVRDMLGLQNTTDLTLWAPEAEFSTALQRFLRDAVPTGQAGVLPPVNSRSKATDREAYARQLREHGAAASTRLDTPVQVTIAPVAKAAAKTATAVRNVRDNDKRPYVIPSDFKLQHPDPVLGLLVKELRRLRPEQHPFSCNYLSRAVLERATILYAKKHQVPLGRDLHVVLAACLDHLVAQGTTATQVKVLRVAAQKEHDATSIQTLGHGVHGGTTPLAQDLKRGWLNKQAGLELLINGAL